MAGSDGAILLTTARWGGGGGSDESPHVYLHELVKSGELPQLVRIVKGSYLGLGAPSLPNPSLSSTVLVASAGTSLRVAVQCLKFKDNHKTVNVGPKLAIPETFDGYFEILNEDGRAVRCIESVAELSRKRPDSCLVRQSIKVYYQTGDKTSDDVVAADRTRPLCAGELLVLVGEVTGSSGGQRFLRCLDSRGDHVYLPMELRAKFSAVVKEDNAQSISGVHRIRSLLNKRLPLTVRMVSGQPPLGLKIGQQFCYEMRLLARFREEMIVAMPLGSTGGAKSSPPGDGVVIIPPSVSLKLQLPANRSSLKGSKEFSRANERCLHQYGLISDRVQVYDANFSKNLRFDGQHWKVPVPLLLGPLRRSTSDLIQSIKGSNKNKESPFSSLFPLPAEEEAPEEPLPSDVPPEYDEIDQIYDYIRGFAPLPKSLVKSSSYHHYSSHNDVYNAAESSNRSHRKPASSEQRRNLYNKVVAPSAGETTKPAPPPLETLPTNRNRVNSAASVAKQLGSAETESPYASASANRAASPERPAKPRMYRQRSVVPSTNGQQRLFSKNPAVLQRSGMLSPAESKQSLTPSPLFNIRYKSMTNLLAGSPADSDTLGSSQSGGRCSGGSAGSAAVRTPHPPPNHLPSYMRNLSTPVAAHHRLMPLHRPRSLTDLLWGRSESRQHKSPLKIQMHPTVVADVIPSGRSSSHKRDLASAGRRRHSGSNHLLNPALGSGVKKHTIFYHL